MFRRHSGNPARAADALRLVSVSKVYGDGANAVTALDDVTLTLPAGSFTAVMAQVSTAAASGGMAGASAHHHLLSGTLTRAADGAR